jgi:hypothetical protein
MKELNESSSLMQFCKRWQREAYLGLCWDQKHSDRQLTACDIFWLTVKAGGGCFLGQLLVAWGAAAVILHVKVLLLPIFHDISFRASITSFFFDSSPFESTGVFGLISYLVFNASKLAGILIEIVATCIAIAISIYYVFKALNTIFKVVKIVEPTIVSVWIDQLKDKTCTYVKINRDL